MATRTITVTLGGVSYTADHLRLRALRTLGAEIQSVMSIRDAAAGIPSPAQFDAMIAILFASVAPHMPGVTLEGFTKTIDDLDWIAGVKQLSAAVTEIVSASLTSGLPPGGAGTGEAPSPAS